MMQQRTAGRILFLNVVEPLLCCPVASAERIHVGAGDHQGYRLDLLQDVADQDHHMLTNGAHIH